jgi:hypothetical protein
MASVDPSKMALAYSNGVNSSQGGNTPVFSSKASENTPSDSFESDNVKREEPKEDNPSQEDSKPKGNVPRWIISTMAWTLPVIASVGSRRFIPEAWSNAAKVGISMVAGGVTASGLEYWRQKNNDGKIKWGNWALNSMFGFVPFDFVLAKMGLAKAEVVSQKRTIN